MNPPRKGNVPTSDKGRVVALSRASLELRLKLRSKGRLWRWMSAVRAFCLALGFQLAWRAISNWLSTAAPANRRQGCTSLSKE